MIFIKFIKIFRRYQFKQFTAYNPILLRYFIINVKFLNLVGCRHFKIKIIKCHIVPHDKTNSFPDDDDLNSCRRIYRELNDELSRMSKDNTSAREFKVALIGRR